MDTKFTVSFLLLLVTLSCVFPTAKTESFRIPFQYPLFKQCNSSWADNVIQKSTICSVGCLLSSISMGLHYYKIRVNGEEVDPGTLNTWLQQNNGYLQNDELIETVLEKINGVHYNGSFKTLTNKAIVENLTDGVITIAHVRNGTHFVLLTGFTTPAPSNTWAVNDPGFNQSTYYTSDIVNFRIFSIQP